VILNFGKYLEENRYFELAFTAYERGIALFKWPIVYEIWDVYLVKFIKR
jgi:pre-mRNA-splicing factor SYF1